MGPWVRRERLAGTPTKNQPDRHIGAVEHDDAYAAHDAHGQRGDRQRHRQSGDAVSSEFASTKLAECAISDPAHCSWRHYCPAELRSEPGITHERPVDRVICTVTCQ